MYVKVLKLSEVGLRKAVEEAVKAILEGGVVVYPTDTVYGVAVNPFSDEYVRKLYEVKGREFSKPVPVLVPSFEHALRYGFIEEHLIEVLRKYWPGKVTVVVRFNEGSGLSPRLTAGTGCIGLRLPGHEFPRMLAERLGGAVTGTSANVSGWQPACTVEEAMEQLGDAVDLYIDGGPCVQRVPSTVLNFCREECLVVEREGAVQSWELVRDVLVLRFRRLEGGPFGISKLI